MLFLVFFVWQVKMPSKSERLGDICARAFLGHVKILTRKRCKSVDANRRSPKMQERERDLEEAQSEVNRLSAMNEVLQVQNAQLVEANAELVKALDKARQETAMAKSIAWKYDGKPPDSGGVLMTYANLVLAQASEAIGYNEVSRGPEKDSQIDSDAESEDGSENGAENGSDGDCQLGDVLPLSKKAQTKNSGTKPVVRRVRFGQECKDLILSFKTVTPLEACDAKLLETVLASQANQYFSSFCEYDIAFQTQWKIFAAHTTLFGSFRQYYFQHRKSVK